LTFLLWAGLGLALGSGLVHAAIGLRRPIAYRHVSFAMAMLFLGGYLLGQKRAYATRSPEELIEIERWLFCFSAGLVATLGWFTCEYTGYRLRRPLRRLFLGVMALFVVGNLTSRYGGFVGSWPKLASTRTLGGERVTTYFAAPGPLQIAWLVFVGLFLGSAIALGVRLARRGQRRKGIALVVAYGMMVVVPVLDVLRDSLGGEWPHLGAVGALSLALIMSIDLSVDFRAQEAALAEALQRSLALRDELNTPLQTLELDLAAIATTAPQMAAQVGRMERALARLKGLGGRLQGLEARGGRPREAHPRPRWPPTPSLR